MRDINNPEPEHSPASITIKGGLDSARLKDRSGGRPKALTIDKAETVRALRQAGTMSVKQICDIMGISRSIFNCRINQ